MNQAPPAVAADEPASFTQVECGDSVTHVPQTQNDPLFIYVKTEKSQDRAYNSPDSPDHSFVTGKLEACKIVDPEEVLHNVGLRKVGTENSIRQDIQNNNLADLPGQEIVKKVQQTSSSKTAAERLKSLKPRVWGRPRNYAPKELKTPNAPKGSPPIFQVAKTASSTTNVDSETCGGLQPLSDFGQTANVPAETSSAYSTVSGHFVEPAINALATCTNAEHVPPIEPVIAILKRGITRSVSKSSVASQNSISMEMQPSNVMSVRPEIKEENVSDDGNTDGVVKTEAYQDLSGRSVDGLVIEGYAIPLEHYDSTENADCLDPVTSECDLNDDLNDDITNDITDDSGVINEGLKVVGHAVGSVVSESKSPSEMSAQDQRLLDAEASVSVCEEALQKNSMAPSSSQASSSADRNKFHTPTELTWEAVGQAHNYRSSLLNYITSFKSEYEIAKIVKLNRLLNRAFRSAGDVVCTLNKVLNVVTDKDFTPKTGKDSARESSPIITESSDKSIQELDCVPCDLTTGSRRQQKSKAPTRDVSMDTLASPNPPKTPCPPVGVNDFVRVAHAPEDLQNQSAEFSPAVDSSKYMNISTGASKVFPSDTDYSLTRMPNLSSEGNCSWKSFASPQENNQSNSLSQKSEKCVTFDESASEVFDIPSTSKPKRCNIPKKRYSLPKTSRPGPDWHGDKSNSQPCDDSELITNPVVAQSDREHGIHPSWNFTEDDIATQRYLDSYRIPKLRHQTPIKYDSDWTDSVCDVNMTDSVSMEDVHMDNYASGDEAPDESYVPSASPSSSSSISPPTRGRSKKRKKGKSGKGSKGGKGKAQGGQKGPSNGRGPKKGELLNNHFLL